MDQVQKILVDDVLVLLEEQEQSILKLYYWAGFTEEEIADSYQISQPRIHQIKQKALEKCKKLITEKQLCVITA